MLKAVIVKLGDEFTAKLHPGGKHGQFDEAVERLKLHVDERAREYDRKRRLWKIKPLGERGLRTWATEIEKVYGAAVAWKDVEIEARDAFKLLDIILPPSTPHAALHLLPSAPLELIEAAYEALARLYDPDALTGDASKLKAAREAYEALTK